MEIAPDDEGLLTRCPYCGTQFFARADVLGLDVVDDTLETETEKPDPSLRLDTNKIRQLTALRRGAVRARSWCWIAATVAAVAAVELIIKAIENVRHTHGITSRAMGFVLFAILATVLAIAMGGHGQKLSREINAPPTPGPIDEPDFTPLSDGSQRWNNLNDVR